MVPSDFIIGNYIDRAPEIILRKLKNDLPTLVAILLLLAIFPLPYAYYTFLRYVVCFTCLYLIIPILPSRLKTLTFWGLVALATLYNPFFPIHLSKNIWIVLNIITATFFITVCARKPNHSN